MSLTGKVVIVTAGRAGIGEGIARRFTDAGARVVIVDAIDARERQRRSAHSWSAAVVFTPPAPRSTSTV
ncbi:SDR family NAD(P)-dependent oxidoreductase [Mycobacterium sp. Aquia_216]|uniref:SDR family NAD(P)-dependent oxidoreductase n=1 Tax=Mycobacterium sp. Aquia_216 TaxID=2991729 RepID=UPI002DD68A30|nr:SDR family NAD(P)-dependent oxidoreductase [Mycobacterium sp. Aquia_216]